MTEELKIYDECDTCGGDGKIETLVEGRMVEIECFNCEGTGYVEMGIVEGAEQLNEIKDSIDEVKEELKEIKEILQGS